MMGVRFMAPGPSAQALLSAEQSRRLPHGPFATIPIYNGAMDNASGIATWLNSVGIAYL